MAGRCPKCHEELAADGRCGVCELADAVLTAGEPAPTGAPAAWVAPPDPDPALRCPECGEGLLADGRCGVCELVDAELFVDEPAPSDEPDDDAQQPDADGALSAATLALLARPLPPPATVLPTPLPPPLSDPARVLKWVVAASLVLVAGVWLIELQSGSDDRPFLVVHGLAVASLWFLFGVWRLLPFRRTDIFYLRSFGRDDATARARADLQRAVRPLRVSGIRDPRRRHVPWLRHFNQLLFVLRYASPKRLNLEAGDDWKQRLWRSLTQARGAVIDVTDLTSFVKDEVRLCFRTLGLGRVLFLIDGRKSADGWRADVADILELTDASEIAVIEKPVSSAGRARFRAAAAAFAGRLPPPPREPSPAGSEVAFQSSFVEAGPAGRSGLPWVEVVGGTLVAGAIMAIASLLRGRFGALNPVSLAVVGAAVWFFVASVVGFFAYLVECGSPRERVLALVTLGVGLLAAPVMGAAPAAWKVVQAAQLLAASDRLRMLGVAMHNYEDDRGHLPGPDADAADDPPGPGRPAVGWPVKLLPYLGEDALAAEYRTGEPWDSPHNRRLIERMPKVFEHPGRSAPPGHTYYRVFVSPPDARGPRAPFVTGQKNSLSAAFPDGAANTILIVEAAEAVPWTMPGGLEYREDAPLPPLGRYFPKGTPAVFANGSVHILPADLPEETLRALVSADGGEQIKAR